MYEEVQTINMSGSGGVFSITINDGAGTRLDPASYSFSQVFANRGSFNLPACNIGTTYTPNSSDGRILVVSFRGEHMAQWESLPPQSINFAPFALEAFQVGGFTSRHLLRVDDATATSNLTPLNSSQFNALIALVNGTSARYVQSTNAGGASIPSLSGAPSTPTAGSMWFDTSTNQLKYYDGTAAQTVGMGGGGSGTVTGITVGTGLVDGVGATGTVITTSGTIALPNVGTAGTYYKVTTDAQGRVSSGVASLSEADTPTLTTAGKVSGGAITSGTIGGTTAISTSGNLQTSGDITAKRIFVQDSGANYAGLQAPATVGATYSLTLPTGLPGSSGMVLSSDTSGNLSWVSPSTGSVTSVGVTAPITIGGTASAPVVGITPASTSTDGYLSNADWNTFNGKLGSTLASGKIWVGNGSNVATAVTPSGDVTVSTAGGFTVTQIQGVAVSAVAPTTAGQVLRYDGTGSYVPALLAVADVSGLSAALGNKIDSSQMPANCSANQTLTFSSPTGTWTCSSIAITGSAFGSQAQNLVLASPDGSAGNPAFRALAANDIPALGASKITSGVLAVAQGGTGTSNGSITGTGALTFAAGGADQNVTLTPSGTGATVLNGNVGVGTTTPGAKLEVSSGTANVSGLKFTDFNSAAPTTAGQPVGVDASGNLVTISVSGSGTVNSGTQNQLAYYGTNGSAVSGLATANNGVLVTDGSGVPSISSTLPLSAQSNITQTGTITSGTWNGSVIGAQYGGTGLNGSAAANGQLLIGNGSGFTLAGITGTANRVSVTNGAGSITLSAPQDIHSGASPTFAGITLSGLSDGLMKSTSGVLSGGNSIDLTADVGGVLPSANGGTGFSAYATGDMVYASGVNTLAKLPAGTNGHVLTLTGGVPTWAAGASSTPALSSLSAATATNTIDNTSFAQTWNWSTASTQNPLALTADALTTGSLLNLTTSSASLNSSGGLLNVANTGVSTNGVLARFQANSAASSGMTILANGNVGMGTTSPGARLEVSSGTANVSGLKFTNFTSAAPTGTGQPVGVDASGNLVTISVSGSGTVNSGTANQMAFYNATGSAVSGNANATIANGALTLGQAGSVIGGLNLSGNTSGMVSINPQAAAGTYNFNLPTAAGTSGQVLTSGGGAAAPMTWTTLAASATTDATNAANITSGTLDAARLPTVPVTAGGTGLSSLATNSLLYGNGTGNMNALAPVNSAVLTTTSGGVPQWSTVASDTFTQYALLAGRAGGQTLYGGTAASDKITIDSTSNATKGDIVLAPSGGNVGIGTTTPGVSLDISAKTDAIALPKGTTAEQPASPVSGWTRYNTTSNLLEFYNGTAWTSLSTGAGITALTGDVTATGPGSTAATVVKVNGVAYPASPSTNTVPVVTGANTITYQAVPNAALANSSVTLGSTSVSLGATATSIAGLTSVGLGVNGTTTGQVTLANGNASGASVTVQNNSATAAYNFNLPATAGTSGQVLASGGGAAAPMTWTTLATSATTDTTNASNISSGTLDVARLPTVTVPYGGTGLTSVATNSLLYGNGTGNMNTLASVNSAVLTTTAGGVPQWSTVASDTFTQYALLAGRAGGQALKGGTLASENLTLDSTANATKGNILLAPSGGNVGVGTTSPGAKLEIASGTANVSGLKFTNFTSAAPTTAGQPVGVDASGNLVTISVSGSGTVNSGTQNQLAWYGANGSAVSGLATAANGVLVTDGSGVPSISSTLPLSAQSNITQTGTITSGTWNGTMIGAQYGGTGLNASAAANGQLLIGNGAGFTLAGITGTANRVSVTNGAGSITLSAPQDIHSGASPTFTGLTLSGLSNGFVKSTSGVLSGGNSVSLTADVSGVLPVANGGTNINTYATGDMLYASAANTLSKLPAGTNGHVLTLAGGVPTWSAGASGTPALSALTAAGAANTIDNLNFAQTWNWSTATTQNPLSISGNALTTGSLLNLTTSNNSVNSTGGLLNVTNSGTSTNGVLARFQSNSTAGSGMTILTNGNVGIGTTSPSSRMHIVGGDVRVEGAASNNANVWLKDGTLGQLWATVATTSGYYSVWDSNNAKTPFQIESNTPDSTVVVRNTGRVGIGTTTPGVSLDLSVKTDAIALPKGTTAQQPGSPVSGWIRYNTSNNAVEFYNGSAWTTLAAAGGSYLSTSGGTLSGALTISSGGASITGGLNNNSGGITSAGSITGVGASITGSGAMTVAAGGTAQNLTLSSSTTGSVNIGSGNGTSLSVLDGGASTVNYVTVKGAAAGASPTIATAGSDANINLTFTPKGTGNTIFSSGNVGVGTSSPVTNFTVQHPPDAGGIVALGGTDPAAAVAAPFMGAAVATGFSTIPVFSFWYQDGTGISNPANNAMAFATSGTERIRITNSGNVGIGTTSPASPLHVASTAANQLRVDYNASNYAAFNVGSGGQMTIAHTSSSPIIVGQSTGIDSAGVYVRNSMTVLNKASSNWITWANRNTSGSESVMDLSNIGSLTASGNVGVGTTSPSTRLEIDSGVANASGVKLSRLTSSSPTSTGQPVGVDASGNLVTISVSDSGTVNSGTQNQLAYYGANGSAVSGLTTANNGVLVTDGSGVPSISSTLPLSAQSNITQTGTITGGTWNGTVIGAQYGGTGLNTSAAANGQLLIGNGSGFTLAGLTGTANRVTVTAGAGSITLNAPQDIHSGASPTFAGLTLSGMSTAGIVKNSAAGVLSGGNTVNLAGEASGTLGVANGGTGLTTIATNSLLYGNGTGNMNALAPVNSAVLTTTAGGIPQWSTIASDTFTQYALLAGRSGGQTLNGGAAANNNLTLDSTANATKGHIVLAPSGGNVGIGTTTPNVNLDIRQAGTGTAAISLGNITNGSYGTLTFSNGTGLPLQILPGTGNDLALGANGSEKMRILSSNGNVGIGTNSPQAGLDIATTGTAASAVIVPRDTTANRPGTAVDGMMRYNSSNSLFEVYENGSWVNMIKGYIGGVSLVAIANCKWTVTTSWAIPSANATCNTATADGTAVSPGKYPAIQFANLPPGRYRVTFNIPLMNNNNTCVFRITDGTSYAGFAHTSSTHLDYLSGDFNYATAQTNITFSIQAKAGASNDCYIRGDDATTGISPVSDFVYKYYVDKIQ